jgi:aspartyl-tRNA(Asn)/glutamyl-tRNA(Gln) amidotransferase subunit C
MQIEDLQETAALAHLNMDEKELAGAFPAFEQMLGYFAAMQAADKDQAAFKNSATDSAKTQVSEAMTAVGNAVARSVKSDFFRTDAINDHDVNNNTLLNNAGERDGRFLMIPNVL